MKKNSKKSITKEQIMKVAEILELGTARFSTNEALMKCPFHYKGNHDLVINMITGKYYCKHCKQRGDFNVIGIALGITLFEEKNEKLVDMLFNSSLKGSFIEFSFKNKNIEDIFALACIDPSFVFMDRNNRNNFLFLYYFENLKSMSYHYKLIALHLMFDFQDVMEDKKLSDKEFIENYSDIFTATNYYNVINDYTDEQLSKVEDLFRQDSKKSYNGGKNNVRKKQ